MFEKVEEFERDGRRYTLYAGGSWTLFEEDDEGASGLGSITLTERGFAVSCWWRPEVTPTKPTLAEAVETLVSYDAG